MWMRIAQEILQGCVQDLVCGIDQVGEPTCERYVRVTCAIRRAPQNLQDSSGVRPATVVPHRE